MDTGSLFVARHDIRDGKDYKARGRGRSPCAEHIMGAKEKRRWESDGLAAGGQIWDRTAARVKNGTVK